MTATARCEQIWVLWKLYVSAKSANNCARISTLQSYHYSAGKLFTKLLSWFWTYTLYRMQTTFRMPSSASSALSHCCSSTRNSSGWNLTTLPYKCQPAVLLTPSSCCSNIFMNLDSMLDKRSLTRRTIYDALFGDISSYEFVVGLNNETCGI